MTRLCVLGALAAMGIGLAAPEAAAATGVAGLLGNSIELNWNDNISLDTGDGYDAVHTTHNDLKLYVSEKGRVFAALSFDRRAGKLSRHSGSGSHTSGGSSAHVSGDGDNRLKCSLGKSGVTCDSAYWSNGVRRYVITVDDTSHSCSFDVIYAKKSGAPSIDIRGQKITNVTTDAHECVLRPGNIVADQPQ